MERPSKAFVAIGLVALFAWIRIDAIEVTDPRLGFDPPPAPAGPRAPSFPRPIQAVELNNLTYYVERGDGRDSVRLSGGRFEGGYQGADHVIVETVRPDLTPLRANDPVVTGDMDGDGQEEAATLLRIVRPAFAERQRTRVDVVVVTRDHRGTLLAVGRSPLSGGQVLNVDLVPDSTGRLELQVTGRYEMDHGRLRVSRWVMTGPGTRPSLFQVGFDLVGGDAGSSAAATQEIPSPAGANSR